MIHAFIYLLIGSAIAYLMQSHIQWLAETCTHRKWVQVVLKIFFDAWLSLTWIIAAPALLIARLILSWRKR